MLFRSKKSGVLAGRGAGTIGAHTGSGTISASAESSSENAATMSGQQLVVSDGGSGNIYESAGLFSKAVTVHLRAIGKSGAHVEIRELDSSSVGEHGLVTEIDVPLNEWRTIGGISRSETGRRRELLGGGRRAADGNRDIQLRVEAEAEETAPARRDNRR